MKRVRGMKDKGQEKDGAKEKTEMEAPKKKLLLNRASLNLSIFASKKGGRYNGVHITENYVEATNGLILVRLSHPKADPDEFPVVPGEPFDKIDFILPGESLKEIKIPTKVNLPILLNACLSKEGEMISASVTDLQTMRMSKIRPIDGGISRYGTIH